MSQKHVSDPFGKWTDGRISPRCHVSHVYTVCSSTSTYSKGPKYTYLPPSFYAIVVTTCCQKNQTSCSGPRESEQQIVIVLSGGVSCSSGAFGKYETTVCWWWCCSKENQHPPSLKTIIIISFWGEPISLACVCATTTIIFPYPQCCCSVAGWSLS